MWCEDIPSCLPLGVTVNSQAGSWQSQLRKETAGELEETLGPSQLEHVPPRNSSITISSSFPIEDLIFQILGKSIWQRSQYFIPIFNWW